MAPNPFSRKSALRAALMVTGSTYVVYASGLLMSALIARALGPEHYGQYAYLVWMSGMVNMLSTNGLTGTGIRFISESLGREDRPTALRVHRWLQVRYWFSVSLISLSFLVVLPFVEPKGWGTYMWVFAVAVLLSAYGKADHIFKISMAKGYGRFGIEASTSSVLSLVNTLTIVLLFVLRRPLNDFVVAFVVINLAHGVMTSALLKRAELIPAKTGELEPELVARMRNHLMWSVIFALVGILGNKSIETFLLNDVAGAAAVAYFSIAVALTRGGIDLLVSGLNTILLPALSHAFGSGDTERVNRITGDSMRYCHFLGLVLAGVGLLWAEPAVALMYGAKYAPTVFLMQVLVVVGGFTLSNGTLGALLTSTDHQRLRAIVFFVSLVVNAVTAIALVPRFGLNGAIASSALSTVLVFLMVIYAVVKTLHVRLPYAELVRITLAAGLAIAPALALRALSNHVVTQWVSGLVFVAAYGLVSILLRVWTRPDLSMLHDLGTRVPPLRAVAQRIEPWVREG